MPNLPLNTLSSVVYCWRCAGIVCIYWTKDTWISPCTVVVRENTPRIPHVVSIDDTECTFVLVEPNVLCLSFFLSFFILCSKRKQRDKDIDRGISYVLDGRYLIEIFSVPFHLVSSCSVSDLALPIPK